MTADTYFDGPKFRHAIPSNAGNSAVSHRPKSRNFQIDATAAVNSQQERRIQLQGNSPYTTRPKRTTPRVRGLAADNNEAAWPKKRRCPQAGIHPKPSQPPHAHHPWFLHRGSSTNIGIGPRPPFQRPDAGCSRAEITICKLSWAARLQLEHS